VGRFGVTVVSGVMVGLVTGVLSASAAQESSRPAGAHRIGILTLSGAGQLRERLRDLGYIEGRNVVFEIRDSKGRADVVDELAAELVRAKVDVIVASNPAFVFGARRATTTIPIVMVHTPDPVELGLVASLAHPGGNITGTTSLSVSLSIKQLDLLKEAVPKAARIAVLWNPDNPWHPITVRGLRQERRSLGVQLQMLAVRSPDEFAGAFRAMTRDRAQAVLVLADPMTFVHRRRLADLAAKHRLPLMGSLREYADAGGLLAYWADGDELLRRAADYVDKILRGAKPADLPIEQPTRYELVVNRKTAGTLGLTLPRSLLLRADQVIE
jgi:putative ABC transport system substrate-binding protein